MDGMKIAEERTLARRIIRQTEVLQTAKDSVRDVMDDWPDGVSGSASLALALDQIDRSVAELERAL